MTPARSVRLLSLLARVAAGDVTWRRGHGRSFRLWSDEHTHTTVTPDGEELVRRGLVECPHGWQHGRGPVEITQAGRAALEEFVALAEALEQERAAFSKAMCDELIGVPGHEIAGLRAIIGDPGDRSPG